MEIFCRKSLYLFVASIVVVVSTVYIKFMLCHSRSVDILKSQNFAIGKLLKCSNVFNQI